MAASGLSRCFSCALILVLVFSTSGNSCSACEPDRQCSSTGSVCVDSCTGLPNGYYQWCGRCDFYLQCLSGTDYYHPCEPDLVYDHALQRCGSTSITCSCDSGVTTTPAPGACSSGPCSNGASCEDNPDGGFTCSCSPGWTGTTCESLIPCSELTARPYPILIQQHIDGSTFFDKSWNEMLVEQGSTSSDYWIGLTELSYLLAAGQGRFKLSVDLFNTTGGHYSANYDTFLIGSESENFTLTVGGYSGNAEDAMSFHNGMRFSTHDRDNDISSSSNVAEVLGGAWWYSSTCRACLNSSPSAYYSWTYIITIHLQSNSMYINCFD